MILVGQYDSLFTRRVAVTLHLYGLPFTRDTRSVFADADQIRAINPLTRIPALILDSGEVLIDSVAIIDHLDETAGPHRALVPPTGAPRRRILQDTALVQGTAEKIAAVAYERHFHAPECVSKDWEHRCLGQLAAGLAEIENRIAGPWFCGAAMTHADVMATCTLAYLRLRLPEALDPARSPRLIALADCCEALPAFRAARISPNETMPSA